MSFYRHKNQIVYFEKDHLEKLLLETERRHRNGEIEYSSLSLSKNQLAKVKEDWPHDALKTLQQMNKESMSDAPAGVKAYNILSDALTSRLNGNKDSTGRIAAASLAFSMMTGTAPAFPTTEIMTHGESSFWLKPSQRPRRLVVDCHKVNNADFFVLGLFDKNLRRCVFLGWESAEGMKKAPRGNRITDPDNCRWSVMSYYKPLESLRPMLSLLREMGIKMTHEGVVFEIPPNECDVPMIPAGANLDKMVDGKDEGDDYYEIIGLDLSDSGQQPQQELEEASLGDEETESLDF